MKQCPRIQNLFFRKAMDKGDALAAFLQPPMLFVTDVHDLAVT